MIVTSAEAFTTHFFHLNFKFILSISSVDLEDSSLSLTMATTDCFDILIALVLLLGQNRPTPKVYMLLGIKRIQTQSNLNKKLPEYIYLLVDYSVNNAFLCWPKAFISRIKRLHISQ